MSKLPNCWSQVPIRDVAQIVSGGTPPSKDSSCFTVPGQGIAWLTPADLSGYKFQTIARGNRDLTPKGLANCSAKVMPSGSVLFSSRAPIGYVAIASIPLATNQGFKSFVFPDEINNRFAYYQLRHIKPVAEALATGTTFKELSGAAAAKLPFLVVPINEQQRIADKLDTVLARVDAVNERLVRVAPLLKRFRQSVLAAATSGRLTASGESESTSNTNWPVITVGSACRLQNGYAFKSEIFKSSGDFQVVKLANVKDGQLKLDSSPAYVDACDIGSPFALQPNAGDILISMTGTRHKRDYGYVCAVPDGVKILVNQRVGRLSPDVSRVSGKFLLLSLMSSEFRDQFFAGETGGVNQGNVGSEHIKSCTFRCPPLQEQTEIVRRVEQLFAFADRLEARLQAAQTASARLTPALLAKAFRGELVPQDPNDEPAAELLRRLAASKSEPAKKPRARKATA